VGGGGGGGEGGGGGGGGGEVTPSGNGRRVSCTEKKERSFPSTQRKRRGSHTSEKKRGGTPHPPQEEGGKKRKGYLYSVRQRKKKIDNTYFDYGIKRKKEGLEYRHFLWMRKEEVDRNPSMEGRRIPLTKNPERRSEGQEDYESQRRKMLAGEYCTNRWEEGKIPAASTRKGEKP